MTFERFAAPTHAFKSPPQSQIALRGSASTAPLSAPMKSCRCCTSAGPLPCGPYAEANPQDRACNRKETTTCRGLELTTRPAEARHALVAIGPNTMATPRLCRQPTGCTASAALMITQPSTTPTETPSGIVSCVSCNVNAIGAPGSFDLRWPSTVISLDAVRPFTLSETTVWDLASGRNLRARGRCFLAPLLPSILFPSIPPRRDAFIRSTYRLRPEYGINQRILGTYRTTRRCGTRQKAKNPHPGLTAP